jgi:DNA-directed RNA polymerase subunit K|tara:strand:+ start:1417 stop:1626 length:210 start_codon:yes stop_codon:yes gene_type:complete
MIQKEELTRFERARIIGARCLQLAMGAPSLLIDRNEMFDPILISIEELDQGLIPLTVKRSMPFKKDTKE